MALEAASSIFFSNCRLHFLKKSTSSVRFGVSCSRPALNFNLLYNLPLLSSSPPTKKPAFQLHSTVESLTVEEEEEQEGEGDEEEEGNPGNTNSKKKLFVLNLPWSFSVADIKNVFSECGSVADVEIIKQKNGKSRGFAFVTMSSGEEAQLAIEKFDSYELAGRIIRVQFAKKFKKPARTIPEGSPPASGETRHKLFVTNLAWKVRSSNLREFFSSGFNPVSVRVVFGGTVRKSAGYGFVSFGTKEEAESAISALDGKELLGRPVQLRFSENKPAAKQESTSGALESKDESSSDASESKQEASSGALEITDESSSDASKSKQESGEQGS
ncbi:hypothetical protein ACS0TY_001501 [Phlomoides rotata]